MISGKLRFKISLLHVRKVENRWEVVRMMDIPSMN